MEYGIDQALKIYSGGLGYLAGSHVRSAYDLKLPFIGIGVLWKYGYYDQVRKSDRSMDVLYMERMYPFLKDTGIRFEIYPHRSKVQVKVYYLEPETFGTAPLFLLSTDIPENDHLSRTITHHLYDPNLATRIAQFVLLGYGGAKLLDILGYDADVYHLNESHSIPAAIYLYEKYKDLEAVREKVVFTTHTPEPGGNMVVKYSLLDKMNFFDGVDLDHAKDILDMPGDAMNMTLAALRMSGAANGVSQLHKEVSKEMWAGFGDIPEIQGITNAQHFGYWADKSLKQALDANNDQELITRKRELKENLADLVADQTGKLFDPDVLTIVWARRFAGYKRADLITRDLEDFERIIKNEDFPVQIIWSGKPYPKDQGGIDLFNKMVALSKKYDRVAVVTGYELAVSKKLKQGSDIWLNTPVVTREASGTSGMTAAMNASVNFSTWDGWIPEFGKDGHNSFIIPEAEFGLSDYERDEADRRELFRILENEIIPTYYKNHDKWLEIMKNSMKEVIPFFDSNRMAEEYFTELYSKLPVKV
jgi:starch phosphorylase